MSKKKKLRKSLQVYDNDLLAIPISKGFQAYVNLIVEFLDETFQKRYETEKKIENGDFHSSQEISNAFKEKTANIGRVARNLCDIVNMASEIKLELQEGGEQIYLDSLKEFKRHLTLSERSYFQNLIEKVYESILFHKALSMRNKNFDNKKCVYVLLTENQTVKIGISGNFNQRKNTVASSSGAKILNWAHTDYLEKSQARNIERKCHKKFQAQRLKGEFFAISFETACEELKKHADLIETLSAVT